ncbi:hypothetical protein SNE40_008686 [Patella caerulea]|uniref:DDE Tnp4 domain-containing protein n=1 Tax=Patella caerulea TaxID=87958 RepID=A0AAN8JQI1_PATCE
MFGPVEGRRHDCALLKLSRLLEQLETKDFKTSNGQSLALYGDPAYPVRDNLLCPFKGANLTAAENNFNSQMSSVRECVEWEFGKIINLFAFLDFKKNLKVMLQPVAKYYLVGALISNRHTCLYGSQTSSFFQLQPPTIEEYLGRT